MLSTPKFPNVKSQDDFSPALSWPSSLKNRNHRTEILKEDDLFLITDPIGNINGFDHVLEGKSSQGTITGFFGKDSRFLSRSELQIEGKSPIPLGIYTNNGYAMEITCTNPLIPGKFNSDKLALTRKIALRGALIEEISIQSFENQPIQVQISLSFAADFRDLFEVRQYANRDSWGKSACHVEENALLFQYLGLCDNEMSSRIEFTHRLPDRICQQTLIWDLTLNPHQLETVGYRLTPLINNKPVSHLAPSQSLQDAIALSHQTQEQWSQETTQLRTNHVSLNNLIEQAEQDIYLLLQSFNGRKVLAAGIPWYSTLFGRDAIIAAQQTLMFDPDIARDTLITLANYQGKATSSWHDEEPGKVMHELRLGEMARCHEIPHTPYYGTIDATPLWVLLYLDYFEWTGDRNTLDQLWPNALAAMDWIEEAADDRGYLCYERQSHRGLDNQGWKDSDDCIVNGDGEIAEGAIALCEVQGYMYSAYRRMSDFALQSGHTQKANHWNQKAQALKQRFNQDFWMAEEDFVALALTDDNQQVNSFTSNPGHCLSLDILDTTKAQKVAERLMQPDLFNGWGIRTLSNRSPAYNPMSYHNGSIWPHDNALIAVGMRKLGYPEHSLTLTECLFDMTRAQPDNRPPELFCGFNRQAKQPPIAYPVACSPQAWATGSIFQLIQLMLNPSPDASKRSITLNHPVLPEEVNSLEVRNLRVGADSLDLHLQRQDGYVHCDILRKSPELDVLIRT